MQFLKVDMPASHLLQPAQQQSRAESLLSAREVLTTPCHLFLLQSQMVARISSEAHMLQPTAVGALQVRLCSQ